MVNALRWFWFAAVLAMLSPGASAQTDRNTAEALMRASGMWAQLESVAPQVRAGIQAEQGSRGGNMPPEAREMLGDMVTEIYHADKLRARTLSVIARKLRKTHVPALRGWYQSPTGARITALEETTASDPRDPSELIQEGKAFLESVTPERRALIDRVIANAKVAETSADMMINTALGVFAGVLSMEPSGASPGLEEFRTRAETQRPQMVEAFRTMNAGVLAKLYEPLSDADLTAYADFLASKAGAHFVDVARAGFNAAMGEAATSLGRGMPAMKSRKKT